MPVPARARRAALALTLFATLSTLGCGQRPFADDGVGDDSGFRVADTVAVETDSDQGAEASVSTTVAPSSTTAPAPPLDPTFESIATRATLTAEARRLLASSSPELDDVDALAEVCTLETDVSVLGCYRAGRIAVLAVTDPRLDGMIEVTTGHEVLHAAWARFDTTERERLAGLLRATYERVVTPDLDERVELYRQRDPESVDGELHSILGTEVADVGPELEEYYRRWFDDRSALVALATKVQSTFSSLKASVEELDLRLDALRSDIGAREASLDDERAAIEARSQELDELRTAGRIDEYNAAIDPFNERIAAYNAAVADLEALTAQYNELAGERNALADDYSALVGQITTTAQSVAGE